MKLAGLYAQSLGGGEPQKVDIRAQATEIEMNFLALQGNCLPTMYADLCRLCNVCSDWF